MAIKANTVDLSAKKPFRAEMIKVGDKDAFYSVRNEIEGEIGTFQPIFRHSKRSKFLAGEFTFERTTDYLVDGETLCFHHVVVRKV